MRVVFIGLSAVFALLGILDVADDIRAGAISGRITVPLYPPQESAGQGLGEHESEILSLRDWLQESLEHYVKTGMPLPFQGL